MFCFLNLSKSGFGMSLFLMHNVAIPAFENSVLRQLSLEFLTLDQVLCTSRNWNSSPDQDLPSCF